MTPRLSVAEKACLPALVSAVPKVLAWSLTFEGWCERVREKPLARGLREEVLRRAFDAWREPAMALVRQGWERNEEEP